MKDLTHPVHRHIALGAALVALWWLIVFLAPSSVFWRDSGEFLLGGTFLDIAHPAGFPLFAMASNLLVQLPLGPLALRVHLFSGLCGVLLIFLTIQICRELRFHGMALFASLLLLCSPAMIRGIFIAEAYLFMTLLFAMLVFLYLRARATGDKRYLLAAGFIAGLGIGNHMALVPIALPLAIIWGISLRRQPKLLVGVLVLGLWGSAVYAYLPARASAHPPLNTGSPNTAERFLSVVTDARDRALRPAAPSTPTADVPRTLPLTERLRPFFHDVYRLGLELHPLLLLAAALGICFLLQSHPGPALALLSGALSNLYFFAGWDPDPWLPALWVVTLGLATLLSTVARRAHPIAALALLLACIGISLKPELTTAFELRSFRGAADHGEQLLAQVPPSEQLIAEPSWFLVKYLRDVEGVRPDVPIFSALEIAYPDYFGIRRSSPELVLTGEPYSPTIEPSSALRSTYAEYLHGESAGRLCLNPVRGYEAGYIESLEANLLKQQREARHGPAGLTNDALFHLEALLVQHTLLLRSLGLTAEATRLIKALCYPLSAERCSTVPLSNLVPLLLDRKLYEEAQTVAEELLLRDPGNQVIEENLGLARVGLAQSQTP